MITHKENMIMEFWTSSQPSNKTDMYVWSMYFCALYKNIFILKNMFSKFKWRAVLHFMQMLLKTLFTKLFVIISVRQQNARKKIKFYNHNLYFFQVLKNLLHRIFFYERYRNLIWKLNRWGNKFLEHFLKNRKF